MFLRGGALTLLCAWKQKVSKKKGIQFITLMGTLPDHEIPKADSIMRPFLHVQLLLRVNIFTNLIWS